MQCSLCSHIHLRVCNGCTGGTDDVVIDSTGEDVYNAKREHRLLQTLVNQRKAHFGKVAIKLLPAQLSSGPSAIQYLAVALKGRHPQGIVAIHSELGCVRCTSYSLPQFLGLTCAIELLRLRLALGLCIISNASNCDAFAIQIGNKPPKLDP